MALKLKQLKPQSQEHIILHFESYMPHQSHQSGTMRNVVMQFYTHCVFDAVSGEMMSGFWDISGATS